MSDSFVITKERVILLSGIALLSALSWYYTWDLFVRMEGMHGGDPASIAECCKEMVMPLTGSWSGAEFLMTFVMWVVMMIAMMVPTAIPTVLVYAHVVKEQTGESKHLLPASLFLAGYVVLWTGFSLLATFMQWALQYVGVLSPFMIVTNHALGGAILIAAGIFQFTPYKYQCLARCNTPLQFLTSNWKKGPPGAFAMGLSQGWFCLGCCWLLMLVLFVTGIMNFLWIVILSLFVLLEKLFPRPRIVSLIAGITLIGGGVMMLLEVGG